MEVTMENGTEVIMAVMEEADGQEEAVVSSPD